MLCVMVMPASVCVLRLVDRDTQSLLGAQPCEPVLGMPTGVCYLYLLIGKMVAHTSQPSAGSTIIIMQDICEFASVLGIGKVLGRDIPGICLSDHVSMFEWDNRSENDFELQNQFANMFLQMRSF